MQITKFAIAIGAAAIMTVFALALATAAPVLSTTAGVKAAADDFASATYQLTEVGMPFEIQATNNGPVPGLDLLHFTIVFRSERPIETMTITVLVKDQKSEAANRDAAIARAMELAQLFQKQASP